MKITVLGAVVIIAATIVAILILKALIDGQNQAHSRTKQTPIYEMS